MAFTANFKTLGRAYRDYVELMEHWKDLDCLPILDVDYEELVQEPEPVQPKAKGKAKTDTTGFVVRAI